MIKKILLIAIFSVSCTFSNIGMANHVECKKGDLYLDMLIDTFVPVDTYTARVYGLLHTQQPFNKYEIEFSKKRVEGVMHAMIYLYNDEFGEVEKGEPITIEIDETFEVRKYAKGLYLEVAKVYNWGDRYVEFFWINFEDDIDKDKHFSVEEGKITVCLDPRLYDNVGKQ